MSIERDNVEFTRNRRLHALKRAEISLRLQYEEKIKAADQLAVLYLQAKEQRKRYEMLTHV